ncbi:MAG: hypothetical protein QNJ94_02555 [Alphaproteobacteria bacterium]|nr:hypothetical protein [Alphaproteobacteria bacterium]
MRTIPTGSLLGLLFSTAALAEPQCYVSYHEFEEAVPHVDIDTCPEAVLAKDKGFCRMTINGDSVVVYHFRHGDQSCLVAVKRYSWDTFVERFGVNYTAE